MALIDELLSQVTDDNLRNHLATAVADLRSKKKFGLVYEEHVPESVLLASEVGLRKGSEVMLRKEPSDKQRYEVESIIDGTATIFSETQSAP